MPFPKDFLWGSATSSYQIEGAALEEGRGECIWTRFSHTPGKVLNNDTGDVACDHYHLYKQDVALMRELGLHAYRYSISWPRVLAEGVGTINEAGLDFYDRLTDELLASNIQPWVTLYHWDLPQALQDRGGWTNPDIVKWFTDYTQVVVGRLGDRVKHWITHNEPWCTAFMGNLIGAHAPGIQDLKTAIHVAHHTLLAHGATVPVVRAYSPGAQVGITLNLTPHIPATDHPDDIRLARRDDGLQNNWFLDPCYHGHYPADMVELLTPTGVFEGINIEDVQSAAVPTDFLGINYYMRYAMAHVPGKPDESVPAFPEGTEFTGMGWEVYPQGMADMLLYVQEHYNPPAIYITENGAAYVDPDPADDVVDDLERVSFIRRYLEAAEDAINKGAALKGYFVWSFLDNFEWAYGYSQRFGIIHVDFNTQKRTLKRSAQMYRNIIKHNALPV